MSMTCGVESPRFWKRSLKSIRCSCSELLFFETDDGRTFAGADASILECVVFIAFFLNRCPSPCRLLLASQDWETAMPCAKCIPNSAKAKTVTVLKGQKGDAGAVFDLAPGPGSVSD